MSKIPDSERYPNYRVGEFEVLDPPPTLKVTGGLRYLEPHEYLYFYSFLDDEDTPRPIKAGLALVLNMDAKKLFYDVHKFYADPKIEKWINYYLTLTGTIKAMADSEAYHFSMYLYHTPSAAFQKYERYSAEQNFLMNMAYVNTQSEYIKTAITQDSIRKRKALTESMRQAEEAKARVVKKAKELVAEDPGLIERREEWMSDHFEEYMAGYFVRHPVSLMMDALKTDLEFDLRREVIYAHRGKLGRPSQLLAFYHSGLDLVYVSKSKKDYATKMAQFKNPAYRHPMARNLRRLVLQKTQKNPVGVATFSHPLAKEIVMGQPNIDVNLQTDGDLSEF